MSNKRKLRQQQDRLNRADQLQAAIAALSMEINQISKEGSVAPADCWLMRSFC
ncbi:MAG: hypothetical protein RID53_22675 [Coleofasciculus sp. B1-GNL1-01]|uniref:hypothetical protein n=1 Tax=Coleofasciculus sp. B1-GNL1-01 TaxID=3068484 RepID=UPI0032FE5F14